jgi:hypothetical protein
VAAGARSLSTHTGAAMSSFWACSDPCVSSLAGDSLTPITVKFRLVSCLQRSERAEKEHPQLSWLK